MERRSRLGLWGMMLLWGLVAFPGCSLFGGRSDDRPKAKAEAIFVEPGHPLSACLHAEIARSHQDQADSVLFFDRDSKLRVTPPSKKGAVPYHLHLIHRVKDRSLDFVATQGSKGTIELDLSKFDQPEELVVVSAGRKIVEDGVAPAEASSDVGARREEILTPPYALSFKLVPAEGQIETILSLQRHRWEVQTESGKLTLVTGSPNRRDHLLTLFDPAKAHFPIIAEDPYVYIPSLNGATPPRLTVEVLTSGPESRMWQKAATYHMPDGIDRLVRAGEKPFVFRTSKRDLIAFTPSPRVDLDLPKEPSATSALVKVLPNGLSEKEALRVVLACIYPTGSKGDSAAWLRSHDIAGIAGETFTVDLGHLDPSAFPLTSALALRSIVPWRLTSGRYAPEPPRGTITIPLVAPTGPPTKYSKFLAPKYASHYDFLRFLGAGAGGKKTSGLLDDYLGKVTPDDPNMTPPPPQPPGGGGTPAPGPGPAPTPPPGPGTTPIPAGAGLGGGLGGGPNSNCGCGKDGKNCKNAAAPCKGTCGQGCPANGCCDPGNGNLDGGAFLITKPCPPKGKSCGQNEADCKCAPHEWTREEVRAAVEAAIRANAFLSARYADMDGPNNPVGFAPCHKRTHVADVVAHFWKDPRVGIGGPGINQWHVTYHIDVIFKPCIGEPIAGGGLIINPGIPGTGKPGTGPANGGGQVALNTSGSTGSPLTGATITLDIVDPTNPISTSLNPTIDPNTNLDVTQASNALVGGNGAYIGGTTLTLFVDIIRVDIDTLIGIRTAFDNLSSAASLHYLSRPVSVMNGPDSWTLSLPNLQWGTPVQQTSGSGGGSTTPPTTTPPTPPPPPPPPPPTETKPTRS